MKRILVIALILASLAVDAKAPARRTAGGKAQVSALAAPSAPAKAQPPAPVAFEGVEATKYNVLDLYAKCMSNTCFDEKTGLCRCRDGSAKFAEADAGCRYVAAAIPFREADTIADFKRRAANDCTGFVFAENTAASQTTQSEALAALTVCMKKNCKARGGGDFEVCFDDDAFLAKFAGCQDTYKNYPDTAALKRAFAAQIEVYKAHFCTQSWGVMRDGECFIKIGIGASQKTVQGAREFRVGDKIVCSHESFRATARTNDLLHMQTKKNLVVGSINLVGTAAKSASSIISAVGEKVEAKDEEGNVKKDSDGNAIMKRKTNTAEMGMAVTTSVGSLAGDGIGLWANSMILGQERPGFPAKCFAVKADGQAKPIFHEDPETFYQLRFSTDWVERGKDIRLIDR